MEHETPIGTLQIQVSLQGLRSIDWPSDSAKVLCPPEPTDTATRIVVDLVRYCLDAYFSGFWDHFHQLRSRIPLDVQGTFFQRRAWSVLYALPRMRITYSEVAYLMGNPKAARAVGNACKSNPIPILVPCHRVWSCDGLGGFSGGAERKLWLLEHEACLVKSPAWARTGPILVHPECASHLQQGL